jgi:hypothetical protein
MTQLLIWISLWARNGHPSGTNPLGAIRASKYKRFASKISRNVSKNSNLIKGVHVAPFSFLNVVLSERAY